MRGASARQKEEKLCVYVYNKFLLSIGLCFSLVECDRSVQCERDKRQNLRENKNVQSSSLTNKAAINIDLHLFTCFQRDIFETKP